MAQKKLASASNRATSRTFSINKIKIPKASEVLASRLRDDIVDGRLANGEMLPNERELAESTGLSRSSVREALRLLEIEGLIVTKQGRNGGSMVCQPSRDTIVKTVNLYITSRKTRISSLVEARAAIEPTAALLAARNRTEDDLETIKQLHEHLVENLDDVDEYLRANIDWHTAIVNASHNDLLIAFMESIAQSIFAVTNAENVNSAEVRRDVAKVHGHITKAIEEGDTKEAKRLMESHVNAYAERIGV